MSALRLVLALTVLAPLGLAQGSFVNWESPQTNPLALTPNGLKLLVVNTADDRLEIFNSNGLVPKLLFSVPVGVDPVSVRARNDSEAWVVNQLSDSISVVNLTTGLVTATLPTQDEPCDVIFGGSTIRAYVSCARAGTVMRFNPSDLSVAPLILSIVGQEPRALAVSKDNVRIYVALFRSGNRSTVLGGGIDMSQMIAFPPNVVSDPNGPYAGVNPPPNDGLNFDPPINPALGPPPPVSLIVKQDAANKWMDDNGGDWTDLVSGANAALSGRLPGWNLSDNDVAVIQSTNNNITYGKGLLNICMALAVNPTNGEVAIVGTDATNEVRFEPNLTGTFLRVGMGRVTNTGTPIATADLNQHLTYTTSNIPQSERDMSLGDPRAIVWNTTGTKAYVAGMGSNNVIVVGPTGTRIGLAPTIEVGQGPTGLALNSSAGRLYVLNRFEATISVIDVPSELEVLRVPFHDATPGIVRNGRVHLYGTHESSGLGQIACASCHVDARTDRLAWDLGDPSGASKALGNANKGAGIPGLTTNFQPWHPMKGPMTTQTLQDIIGHEPLHWRGDRTGIEEFADAFVGLQGADAPLTPPQMQAFEDFLDSITIPPNPFRTLQNALPTNLPLPGRFTSGRFGPAGQPLPDGKPQKGLALFRPPNLLDGGNFACVTCHTLPTGTGTDTTRQGGVFVPIPVGPSGEHHDMLVAVDGLTNRSIKVPQLRTLLDKGGFDLTQLTNTAGFGVLHDGSVDSIERFVAEPIFNVTSDQDVADLTAFLLCFSGSNLPQGSPSILFEPPGTASQDTHAAVGRQTTLVNQATAPASQLTLINDLISLAQASKIGLVVKGKYGGAARGFYYNQVNGLFQSDRAIQAVSSFILLSAAAVGSELTFTAVPFGTQLRIGADRDLDTYFDQDEVLAGSDPANASSTPGGCAKLAPATPTVLVGVAFESNQVNLTWNDPATNEDGYRVERAASGGGAWQLIANLPADSTSYPDTGLDCETLYVWRVCAYNCAGSSGFAQGQQTTGACCLIESFCTSSPNSAGPGALIASQGSTYISKAKFTLTATGGVPGQSAMFFYGPAQMPAVPYGDGSLCVSSGGVGLFRIPPLQVTSPAGTVEQLIDFTSGPAGIGPGKIEPGSTWNFQLSYRDTASTGAGYNSSDGISVTFCP